MILSVLKSKRFVFFNRIWSKLSKRRKIQFYLLLLLTVVASFFEAISISMILPFLSILSDPDIFFQKYDLKELYTYLDIKNSGQIVLPITILFISITIFSGLIRLLLLWTQTKLSYAIGADFSSSIYKRTLYQPYNIHINRNSSNIIAGISGKANTIVSSAIMPFLLILSSLFIIITIMLALVNASPIIAISSLLGFALLYIFVFKLTKKKLRSNSKQISVQSSQVVKIIMEGLGGIRDVLIDGTQEEYCKKYKKADEPLRSAQANIQIISNSPRYIIETIGMILISYFAFQLAKKSNLNTAIPIIGSFAFGAQRLLPALQQIFSSLTSMRGGMDSINDALDLLEQPLPIEEKEINFINFSKYIHLSNLYFKYDNKETFILKGIDIKIKKGTKIGLIGKTGSGKSTLLDLIMGLLKPTSGYIYIDDIKLENKNYRNWQKKISHVPQSIFLTDGSIMENIAFGVQKDKINIDKVKYAAKKAQLSTTIENWKNKYDTLVGERGVNLSGGQRQRIGIARALYKESEVIIFDEATSALDNETEANVMDSLDNLEKGITIIIVAHRLTTLKKCDLIISISDGIIEKIGNYEEIINTNK
jgi:ABC-type multidrug transport system fused ATPase/permease subunit